VKKEQIGEGKALKKWADLEEGERKIRNCESIERIEGKKT
jgi:hypothetical protein